MIRQLIQSTQQHSQDIFAATSLSSFGLGIMPILNEYLQAGAFIVAIVSGGIVIWKHFKGMEDAGNKDK